MGQSYCCVTWSELAPELIQAKSDEVESLIKDKGLPRSVFASVIRVLNSMDNYCPSCGSGLKAASRAINSAPVLIPAPPVEEPKPTQVRCRGCAGKGILGVDENSIQIKCASCHGDGYIGAKHMLVDKKTAFALDKLDTFKAKQGLNEDQFFVGPKE